jgi:hypothetical protein
MEKSNMSTRTVTANYQPSFSLKHPDRKSELDIAKARDIANDSAFRSNHSKPTGFRTNLVKKFLIYLTVIGASLAVLPVQAEAGRHHGGTHGRFREGYHHGHFARGYYRYHRGYYYRRYGDRYFYPGYYPYYGYQGPGPWFSFSFN